ncbi:hypothetical protein ACIPN8_20765 [Streptomyces sp. NPDC086082]|uniref:hypothetical protein n=1 Tax=Streptomyces sp. NPDC086082 TaxID=3365750 RepID=UPI0037F82F54
MEAAGGLALIARPADAGAFAAARELLADGAKVVVTGRSSVPSTCCPSRSTPTSPSPSPSPSAMDSGSVKVN